jgi:glycosyltransferase involved in cell wall biosynthesis
VCQAVKSVIAVSDIDAQAMKSRYGISRVSAVPTGVDLDYFSPPRAWESNVDLVFCGAMDWLPNMDGIRWFTSEVLPLIRRRRPDCSLLITGRNPGYWIRQLAEKDSRIQVKGTAPDIRPSLWRSRVSIVPLRIGGGTRLKIYEAMAARLPVVSTAIGAEGLDIQDGENIFIADSPQDFADRCLLLLEDSSRRRRMIQTAWELISACYSWDVVAQKFEALLT